MRSGRAWARWCASRSASKPWRTCAPTSNRHSRRSAELPPAARFYRVHWQASTCTPTEGPVATPNYGYEKRQKELAKKKKKEEKLKSKAERKSSPGGEGDA